MRRTGRHGGSGSRWRGSLAVGAILLAGAVLVLARQHHRPVVTGLPQPAAVTSSVRPTTPPVTPTLQAPSPVIGVPAVPSVPVRVSVPSVGITSGLEQLDELADHSLQPPTNYGEAGWYSGGVRPGATGPAVIAGHVDSYQGPAIFFRLKEIRLGADVAVTDQAGVTRHFRVTDIETYPKDRFPTQAVYGPTPLAVVRLITCTGDFDASKRSYVDNLVVSATLDAPRAA